MELYVGHIFQQMFCLFDLWMFYLQKSHRHDMRREQEIVSGKLCSTYNWKDLGQRSLVEVLPKSLGRFEESESLFSVCKAT